MSTAFKKEEIWNSLTHALGAIMGLVGLFFLLSYNTNKSIWSVFSILVYGISIILLFSASAIYHWVADVTLKRVWRKIDHISIYILIAGTYTPVALITLEKNNGWIIFWVVWSIALLGSTLKLFFTGRFETFSLLLYLFMGWLIVFDVQNLIEGSSSLGLFFLSLGGAFYTSGIIFYASKGIRYNHLIWHLFVLAGAVSHFIYILSDVI